MFSLRCERDKSTRRLRCGGLREQPRSEYLGHGPRLCNTATSGIGCLGVEDFAQRAHPGLAQVRHESLETRRPRARSVLRVELQPRVDQRTSEPPPHGALVVGGVAGPKVAVVLRLVVPMT